MKNKMKIYHDTVGNTVTVWFGDPQKEVVSEDIGNDTVIMKDKKGTVIGLEKLNYTLGSDASLPVTQIAS